MHKFPWQRLAFIEVTNCDKLLQCCQVCDCNVLVQNLSYLPVPKIPHCFISYCSQTGSEIQTLWVNLILVLHYILKNNIHRICVLQKTNYYTSNLGGRLITGTSVICTPVSEVFTDNMLFLLMAQNQKLPSETQDICENPPTNQTFPTNKVGKVMKW
jgi:hypothetical protein